MIDFPLRRLASLPSDGAGFAEAVRRAVRRRGISYRMLALRSGVSAASISRIARGSRMPSLRTAIRLARALEPLP